MKLLVAGVKSVKGKSSKTNADFSICSLLALVTVEQVSNDKIKVAGHGFELAEIPLDEAALDAFKAVKFPSVMELATDTRPYRGKLETIVTGILPVRVAA